MGQDDKIFKNLSDDGVNQLRRWIRIFTVCIILSFAFSVFVNLAKETIRPSPTWQQMLGPPASVQVDESKPLREQTARVELGNRVFHIPLMYVDSNPAPGNVYKDSILLEVIWPEMRSIHELQNRQEYEQIWKKEHRLGWILLEPLHARPTLDQQVSNMQESMTKIEQVQPYGILEKYLWYRGTEQSPELRHEVYLERGRSGHIINYIDCRHGPSSRFPVCSHKFVEDGLMFKISYNEATFLAQWQEQRQRAINFLRSFELDDNRRP